MSVAEVVPRNYENVDDSDGELGDMFNSAIEHLCNIVNNASAPASVKKGIYDWSKKEVNNSIYSDYGCDALQTIYECCCEALGDTDEVLADIDRRIREAKDEYHKSEAVMRKIRFMQSRNMDIQDVIKKYIDVNDVRKIRFKQVMDAKEYDEALLIANRGIEIAKKQGHSGTEMDWQKSMYDIYLTRGDIANLLPLTEYLFFYAGGHFGREEFYKVLKQYTAADNWHDTVERLLKPAEQGRYFDHFAARIMHENQMWTRL
jgi:tetratricopeptide (TPR) repeat protein